MSRPKTELQVLDDLRQWVGDNIYDAMPSVNYVPRGEVDDFVRGLIRSVRDGRLPGIKLDLEAQ